jgi:hypothetical protein
MSFPKPKDLPVPPSPLEQTVTDLNDRVMTKSAEDRMFAEFDDMVRKNKRGESIQEQLAKFKRSPDIPLGVRLFFAREWEAELSELISKNARGEIDDPMASTDQAAQRVKDKVRKFIVRKGGRRRRSSRRKVRVRRSVGLTVKNK